MPKFKSEEGRQRWLAAMAARKGRPGKKKAIAVAQPDGSVAQKTTDRGAIAAAIEEIDSKIAALEMVKRNLLQAQSLVNL